MTTPSPHDFLLHLRGKSPELARRLDHFTSLGLADGALKLKLDTTGWPYTELAKRRGELEALIGEFFSSATGLVMEEAAQNPERLPFPVTASKYWNHLAFVAADSGRFAVLAVPKPVYAKLGSEITAESLASVEEASIFHAPEGTDELAGALAFFVDPLTALAREKRSYVHFLTPFPGDAAATALEARLYAVKEWGTPATPGDIARKYLGRLHYCDPDTPLLGLRLARALLK